MAEKILYILGAGASAFALPISKSVWGNSNQPLIEGLSYSMETTILSGYYENLQNKDLNPILVDMQDRFIELAKMANKFGDIDTYAKYLNIKNPGGSEINNVKRTLSEFFAIKQTLEKKQDRRYLPWLVGLMDKAIFPDNVKILSWNYDFQVQLASSQIGNLEDINIGGNSFTYSGSTLVHYPNLDPTFNDFNLVSLIHLNGIAGFTSPSFERSGSVFQKNRFQDIDSTLSFMNNNKDNTRIHFAWEKGRYHTSLMQHVRNMITGATILVVIGYSFPFYNREVDKQILEQIKTNSLKKIYYQDPLLTGEQMRSQFNIASGIDIIHIKEKENFHIPFEY